MLHLILAATGGTAVGTLFSVAIKAATAAELAKLKAALANTGVKLETYLTGDLSKIKAEAETVLAKV